MSSQERSDDPGGHGYGSTGQDSNIEDAENAVDGSAGGSDKDTSEETENRRAAVSPESPSNVTHSTQDLTIGGSEKDPDHREETSSDAQQAVENQQRDFESGKASPG